MLNGVYVNQINLNKLSSCLQNQKPCMINVNTIQRKGAVRIDVFAHKRTGENLER